MPQETTGMLTPASPLMPLTNQCAEEVVVNVWSEPLLVAVGLVAEILKW